MAQDLSQTIQEGLAQTLTDLLGIDARFQETTQADKRDINSSQLLAVNAEFEFDKLATTLKFIIPANSASIIFNTMMGASDSDVSEVIDDDTIDAMGEFVSNVSGSLVTAFNAKEIEELGKAKFHIQHKEVIAGDSLEDIDNVYRFLIDLDDKPITLFLKFNEDFLPFIEEITKTEPTPYPEEPVKEEEEEEEPIQEPTPENTKIEEEPIPNEPTIKDESTEKQEEETIDEEDEEADEEQKKAKKMKLLIIILSSLIGLIILIFLVIFFMSSPEEDMEKKEEAPTEMTEKSEGKEKQPEEITTKTTKTLKKIDFDIKEIDVARLNGRLATLTKFEILTKEELEAQKRDEAKRLERLKKEEELKEFAKLNKEEPVKTPPKPKKVEIKPTHKVEEPKKEIHVVKQEIKEATPVMEAPTPVIQEEPAIEKEIQKETPKQEIINKEVTTPEVIVEKVVPDEPEKLLFVLTNNIKYNLFKSLVTKLNSSTTRISMCNDKSGRTTILIGPFENMEQQNKMDQLIKDSNENIETTLGELTEEEFNQRCDF